MSRSVSIRIKALFLLVVFSLTTMVGFACSVGINLGFNAAHHQKENSVNAHSHQGKAHQHVESHHHTKSDKATTGHHKKEKKNCCEDEATKFAKLDKVIQKSTDASIYPVSSIAFLSTFLNDRELALSLAIPVSRYDVWSHHPPIPDIRIAVQSFQI